MADSEQPNGPLVLIGIDGSQNSEKAFEWYCDYIHRPEHRPLLIHAAEYPHIITSQAMYASGELWDQMIAQEREKIQKLEMHYSDIMKARGLSGRIKAIFGSKPGEVISSVAQEEKVDMIVVGCRGHNTLRRTILGSVSDYVLHHAHCPVLVCRH